MRELESKLNIKKLLVGGGGAVGRWSFLRRWLGDYRRIAKSLAEPRPVSYGNGTRLDRY